MCLCVHVVCKINLQAYNSVCSYHMQWPFPREGLIQYSNPTIFPVFWRKAEVGTQNKRFHYNIVLSAAEDISLAYFYLEFSLSKYLVGGEFSSWFTLLLEKSQADFFFFI